MKPWGPRNKPEKVTANSVQFNPAMLDPEKIRRFKLTGLVTELNPTNIQKLDPDRTFNLSKPEIPGHAMIAIVTHPQDDASREGCSDKQHNGTTVHDASKEGTMDRLLNGAITGKYQNVELYAVPHETLKACTYNVFRATAPPSPMVRQ